MKKVILLAVIGLFVISFDASAQTPTPPDTTAWFKVSDTALYKGKYKSYVDAYFAVFFPLAIGKPDDWVIQSGGLTAKEIYDANPAFANVKDGKLRVWEVKKTMLERLPSQWLKDGSFSLAVKAYKNYIAVGVLSILAGLTLYYYYGRSSSK